MCVFGIDPEGLLDDDTVRAEFSLGKHGKRLIMPTSFVGGPRNMSQLYQDAMALIRKHGRPDLFITFTCNPKWPELCKLEYQLGILKISYLLQIYLVRYLSTLRDYLILIYKYFFLSSIFNL